MREFTKKEMTFLKKHIALDRILTRQTTRIQMKRIRKLLAKASKPNHSNDLQINSA
jgi:hypothetical protein